MCEAGFTMFQNYSVQTPSIKDKAFRDMTPTFPVLSSSLSGTLSLKFKDLLTVIILCFCLVSQRNQNPIRCPLIKAQVRMHISLLNVWKYPK